MNSDGSASTAMLGLGGELLAVSSAFGELEQAVETTATSAWCEGCGVAALPHGRRPVRVRDLPSSEQRGTGIAHGFVPELATEAAVRMNTALWGGVKADAREDGTRTPQEPSG